MGNNWLRFLWAAGVSTISLALTTAVSLATKAEISSSVLLTRRMTLLLCLLHSHVVSIHAVFDHYVLVMRVAFNRKQHRKKKKNDTPDRFL